MQSFEALGLVIGRDAEVIADVVGREAITLRRWKMDPTTSGARNPLDTVRIMMEEALRLGRDPKDALAPIRYLQECFAAHIEAANLQEAHQDLFNEFSQLLNEHTTALRDGRISQFERRRIEREASHVATRLEEYVAAVKEFAE